MTQDIEQCGDSDHQSESERRNGSRRAANRPDDKDRRAGNNRRGGDRRDAG